MPAQTPVAVGTAYYSQNDTAPDLIRILKEGDGTPIDLTNATGVTILIGRQRDFHYYSPYPLVVDRDATVIDPDPTTGSVAWTPGTVRDVDQLYLPGTFDFLFEITWVDGTIQSVPAHTYETIVVTTKPGGIIT